MIMTFRFPSKSSLPYQVFIFWSLAPVSIPTAYPQPHQDICWSLLWSPTLYTIPSSLRYLSFQSFCLECLSFPLFQKLSIYQVLKFFFIQETSAFPVQAEVLLNFNTSSSYLIAGYWIIGPTTRSFCAFVSYILEVLKLGNRSSRTRMVLISLNILHWLLCDCMPSWCWIIIC